MWGYFKESQKLVKNEGGGEQRLPEGGSPKRYI